MISENNPLVAGGLFQCPEAVGGGHPVQHELVARLMSAKEGLDAERRRKPLRVLTCGAAENWVVRVFPAVLVAAPVRP